MQSLGEVCARLREWPRRVVEDDRALAEFCLDQCCIVFRSPRGVLLIEHGDEPWLNIATRSGGEFAWIEDEDMSLDSVVAEELADRSFFIDERGAFHLAAGVRTIDNAIDPRVGKLLGEGATLSAGILGHSLQGRLFVCNPDVDASVALSAADAIGVLLSLQFEASAELRNRIREALEQERTKVARDLHDGLLQSFTGVVLQLETVHSMLITDPERAQRLLTQTQGMIMSDQRELRRFVEELKPRQRGPAAKFDFAGRLEDLRSRFANQWGIRVNIDVANIDPLISGMLGQETFRLISEAVTNSAKHGRASDVHVGVRTAGSEMHIEVSDNGSGFPFHGRLTLDEIRQSGSGPTMLAERVSSLNGNLIVDSTESGSVVTMTVPLGFGA